MRDNLPNMLKAAAKEWREKNKVVSTGETRYDAALEEAADAIEELQKRVDESIPKDDAEIIIAEVAKPRWIPVTERLPEAESGSTSKPVLVTDGDCMAIAEWFNFELCEPYWSYTGIGDITHWMPLPEPPKEE
ncbi:MAG: DUF551 domain-containing protein [Eubacteriales bacterium]|nr:DUF551 domain-containing protein [Eubacteriales bacterium]